MEEPAEKQCKIQAKRTTNIEDQVTLPPLAADMPLTTQQHALCFTTSFLDAHQSTRLKPSQLAFALKKEFDSRYGVAWHCIVGKSFGSYVTHSKGAFLYFSFDSFFVLLFQTRLLPLSLTS